MNLEAFHVSDKGFVRKWLACHQMNLKVLEDLPEHGYIAFDDMDRPVAAGFIRRVEGNYALIDSLISNPEAPGVLRNEALDLITVQLIKTARELGFKQLIAFSRDVNTLKRAERHGFASLPDHVIALDLGALA